MGTINYFTSDYITIGVNPDKLDQNDIEWLYDCIKKELNKYSFWYYHVTIEPGYYEGFSIRIENNFPVAFDNFEEKREAQKEITQLKDFLLNCIEGGLCACFPGWCTGYLNYNDSRKKVSEATKEMRKEIASTPTWLWYERNLKK